MNMSWVDVSAATGLRRMAVAISFALLLVEGSVAFGHVLTTPQPSKTKVSSPGLSKSDATWKLAGYIEQSKGNCNPSTVQHYLSRGASPDAQRPHDEPALFVAAYNGATACALILLKHGATYIARIPDGTRIHALSEAVSAYHCDASLATALIKAGDNPNYLGSPGDPTILQEAALQENTRCAKVLIEHGAAVNHIDDQHGNALLEAQFGKKLDGSDREPMTKLLLENGADPNLRGPFGLTALFVAMGAVKVKGDAGPCVACINLLIAAGANPNVISDKGYTPLLFALRPKIETSAAALTALIGGGANVNLANPKTGETPLMAASAQGSTAIVDLLLNNGADRCALDKSKRSASDYAHQNGHPDLIQTVACQGK